MYFWTTQREMAERRALEALKDSTPPQLSTGTKTENSVTDNMQPCHNTLTSLLKPSLIYGAFPAASLIDGLFQGDSDLCSNPTGT